MSGPERSEPVAELAQSLKRKRLSQEDQDELDKLDIVFKRIKKEVPPTAPYILSAPSMDPYRYHSQQEANAWMMGRLFKADEESLQYRTYMYREPCQDCLELQAGEDEIPEASRQDSRLSNMSGVVAKKKLNLKGFKVTHANGTVTPGSKKVSPALAPTKVVPGQANGVKEHKKQSAPDQTAPSTLSKKPTLEAPDQRKPAKPDNSSLKPESRPRAQSPSRKLPDSKINVDKSNNSDRTPHGLPPLLSPVHEPPTNPHGLPNILSPTLPSNIQAELDKIENQRNRAESNASTSSSDRKSQTLTVPDVAPRKPAEAIKTEPRIRTVSTNGKSPNVEPAKRKETADPSLIVKLKYSKAKAPTVKQLLRLPPKRNNADKKERQEAKDTSISSQTKEADEEPKKKKPIPKFAARRSDNTTPVSTPIAKSVTTPTPTPTTKAPEKRPRAEDDVGSAGLTKRTRAEDEVASSVPAKRVRAEDDVGSTASSKRSRVEDEASSAGLTKRPRAPSSQDRPHTPTQQVVSSPSLSNKSSAQKVSSQYTTPKNSLKTVSMLRTNSTESNDSTPGRSVTTPAGVKVESKAAPTSAPLNSKKQADISLLAQTSMKLNQMGRTLKHEATKILTAAGKQVTKQEEKRAAVINMECIMSYMAAYFAQDASLNLRGRPAEVEQTWKTLLPLCTSFVRSTKDFKHLDGLRSYLGSVIASAICTHVSQRSPASRPHDSPHDVPNSDLAKPHAILMANFALLSDHTMKMNQHYQDARIALPFEDIQSMYKKTFASREANTKVAKEPEKINGARMSGPYFLPLSNDTTPIQAVRFGLKFLAEYCEKEKLDYKLRINLDKAE